MQTHQHTHPSRPWRRRRAAGNAAPRERGTVLLMVLGVLALMSIIAVVYAAVGQGDRRASAALVKDQTLEDQTAEIAEYLAGVVGRDTLSTYFQQGIPDAGIPDTTRREATDYPYTDRWLQSQRGAFGSSAGYERFSPSGSYGGPWNGPGAADPRVPSDSYLAATEPSWLGDPVHNSVSSDLSGGTPEDRFLNNHDWRAITNIAPSGNFVNLYNLRNNFFAESGFGVDVNSKPRMSENLTLFDDQGRPYRAGSTQRMPFGINGDDTAEPKRPYDWTMNQRWLFRPALDKDRAASEAEYLPYQYADADGDGFFDSRWCELVDCYDPDNTLSLIKTQGPHRLFIAARVIDLSGLVSVNSAMDFGSSSLAASAPAEDYPAGLSPADVDMRRLLTLSDFFVDYGAGYDGLLQPPGTYNSNYSAYDAAAARTIGLASYAATQDTLVRGRVPNPSSPFFTDLVRTAGERAVQYQDYGTSPFGAQYTGTQSVSVGQFSASDELELRTFNGVNDPRRRSRLEAVMGGRLSSDPELSPLRDNRSFDVERPSRDTGTAVGPAGIAGTASRESLLAAAVDVRHLLTTIGGARPLVSQEAAPRSPLADNELRKNLFSLVDCRYTGGHYVFAPTNAQVNSLMQENFLSLVPHAFIGGAANNEAWDCGSPDPGNTSVTPAQARNRALAYGRSTEVAYRLSAHMALNFADMNDTDHDIRARTLRVLGSAPGVGTPAYPWPVTEPTDTTLLSSQSTHVHGSQAVNIFGIESQPFLVQATQYQFFTDTPPNLAGPVDGDDEPGAATPPNLPNITVNTTRRSGNADYLMEVLAFQVTNPFDTAISLSDAGGPKYYIEYAGRFFPLAPVNDLGTAISGSVTLEPRRSRTFFAANLRDLAALNNRWQRAGSSPTVPTNVPGDFINRWADREFNTVFADRRWTRTGATAADPRLGPITFLAEGSNGFVDIQGETVTGMSDAQRKVVFLWGVVPNQGVAAPVPRQDYLVDRMHDPAPSGSEPTLFHRIDESNFKIASTEAGDDTNFNPFDNQDNTGYAIGLWSTLRRPTGLSTSNSDSGAMPAWTYEARADNNSPAQRILNYRDTDNQDWSPTSSPTSWPNGEDGVYDRFRDLVRRMSGFPNANSNINPLDDRIHQEPNLKSGADLGFTRSRDQDGGQTVSFRDRQIVLYDVDGATGRNPGMFLRTGDLLLPFALGPSYDPAAAVSSATGYTDWQAAEKQWMTLAECFALATDYYSPTPVGGGDPNDLFVDMGHSDLSLVGDAARARLDRGRLNLDAFVPFDDDNGDGVFDPTENAVSPGLPAAMNILARLDTIQRPRESASPGEVRPLGSKISMVGGRININTAPLSVLRLLPMLSPTSAGPDWWWITGPQHGPDSDIASTLLAYRDKLLVETRNLGAAALTQINFRDDNDGNDTPAQDDDNGREFATGIAGVRESPGFASVSEVLAVRDINATTGGSYLHNIDRLGYDGLAINNPGVLNAEAGAGGNQDAVVDDYAERLAIADAVMNCVDVRSDVFCVWFVVHGYLPSDAQDLAASDPLTPSISRRYVMVLDRSNVVKETDEPRVLLLQEVPM